MTKYDAEWLRAEWERVRASLYDHRALDPLRYSLLLEIDHGSSAEAGLIELLAQVRNEALDEAARVVEAHGWPDGLAPSRRASIAAAIRARKEMP